MIFFYGNKKDDVVKELSEKGSISGGGKKHKTDKTKQTLLRDLFNKKKSNN